MRRPAVLSSPFAPVLLIVAALVAVLVRWQLQGSHNVYTALSKRFYVPDADLGWRISGDHPVWIGLEVCGVLLGVAVVVALAMWRLRRSKLVRGASWAVAVAALALPIVAFATGGRPLQAHDTLPPKDAVKLEAGIGGSLDAPSGTYVVGAHAGTAVTAQLSAGGEAFDARFADVTGSWRGDPHNLGASLHAEVSVTTASIDTGVRERSNHARDGYLQAGTFPRITVTLDRATAVRQMSPRQVAFRAPATVALMGKTHPVDVTGTLAALDADAQARIGVTGDVLLVDAELSLPIHETALAPKAGDLDGDRIPIHVSLVLRRQP